MTKHISELLKSFVAKEHKWKIRLFRNWENIIGALNDKVIILSVKKKFLILGVTHPTWAQELFMLSDILKKRINSLFEKDYIEQIRFRLIYLDPKKKINNKKEGMKKRSVLNDNLRYKCLNKIEEKRLHGIKDQELKFYLEKFCLRCKRRGN